MKQRFSVFVVALLLSSGVLLSLSGPAWAIPAFARRYGIACSSCHDAWPHLNAAGWSFKLSGYRRLNGRDLEPTTKDIEVALGALSMPAIPPLAITATVGFDWRQDKMRAADGTTATRTGSSLDLESVEVFAASPLGQHLSFFTEFPMFETHAESMDEPTGPSGANATDSHRNIQFETESPAFEKGKLMWNTVLPFAPPDSLNITAGVDELPFAYSPEGRRLSVQPYLVYRRRALDLLSPVATGDLLAVNEQADRLLRFGEPQILVELNGLLVPSGNLTDLAKPETLSFEYHVGVTNGTNIKADANTQKDIYGRFAARWWGQTLGVFGYWSPDIYDDDIRDDGSIAKGGIMSGRQAHNRTSAIGPDLTLSLEPWNIPVWMDNQFLLNHESDPTGFGKSFEWWGGFSQLNARVLKPLVIYGRYDWIHGERFDDTGLGGVTGPVRPREWDAVAGIQWYVLENFKLLAEYGYRKFENNLSSPAHERLTENFFTVRASLGF